MYPLKYSNEKYSIVHWKCSNTFHRIVKGAQSGHKRITQPSSRNIDIDIGILIEQLGNFYYQDSNQPSICLNGFYS